MYINHPESDKGSLIIVYVTLDSKFSVTAFQEYPNPHLQMHKTVLKCCSNMTF